MPKQGLAEDAHVDTYLIDYVTSGIEGPHERANQALMRADLALTIISERGDDLDRAQAEAIIDRVALAAAACATAVRIDRPELADEFAKQANSEVLVLTNFDYVNVG